MKFRRPRNTTVMSIVIFLISFGFWLTQPQAPRAPANISFPDVSWVFVTTTVAPQAPDTTQEVVETTLPPDTTLPVETIPIETTIDPPVETTVAP